VLLPSPWVFKLPAVNAAMNGASAAFLLCGYYFIRTGRILAHKTCMISAFTCSTIFLSGYLYYHATIGVVRFGGEGWIRPAYLALLTSHTILAFVNVPLAIVTLYRALTSQFPRHRRIARWTFPVWLYVSVTGVIIYWLLFQAYTPRMPQSLSMNVGLPL